MISASSLNRLNSIEPALPLAQRNCDPSQLVLEARERWYVAMTQPHKERYAAVNLANQGFRHFLPLQWATRRHARQFRTVLAPVFPRYVFIILDPTRDSWRSVNGTFGVQYLLTDKEAPLPVTTGVIETLMQSSDPEGRLIYEVDQLSPGDPVRLLAGPLAGSLGVLQRLDASGRVELLMQFMGSPLKVTARRDVIAAAR